MANKHKLGVEEAIGSKPRRWLPLEAMAEAASSLPLPLGNSRSPLASGHITLIPTCVAA